jgi:hypothetical protein
MNDSALLEMANRLDPVCFAESLGFACDPWQADLLRDESPRLLVCCARQTGKTTCAALRALHTQEYGCEFSANAGSLIPDSRGEVRPWTDARFLLHGEVREGGAGPPGVDLPRPPPSTPVSTRPPASGM